MKLKLFDFEKFYDYGWEFFFQFLTIPKKFALLDISLRLDDDADTQIFPEIGVSIGSHRLFAFYFRWGRFEFQCDIMDTRPRGLMWYRGAYDE